MKVTLANKGSVSHTLTLYQDEAFTKAVAGADTDRVSPGSSKDFTVTLAAGEYYFRCEVHPSQMKGEIVVK